MPKGLFVVFEGPDGAGKSTLAKSVFDALTASGTDCIMTREPGGTPVSEKIRSLILDPLNSSISHRTELILFAAARSQHLDELIFPALEAGKIVICDRFNISTYAYQGYGRGFSLTDIDELNEFVVGDFFPDITFMINVDLETAKSRLKQTGKALDRMEQNDDGFFTKVRDGYTETAIGYPGIVNLDGNLTIEELRSSAVDKILSLQKFLSSQGS